MRARNASILNRVRAWKEHSADLAQRIGARSNQRSVDGMRIRHPPKRLSQRFLRAGFSAADLKRVIIYLQKEIRAERRNIGALKLQTS